MRRKHIELKLAACEDYCDVTDFYYTMIDAASVTSYLYIKLKGGKRVSKTDKPDLDAGYHDKDEIAL